jgi:hypothetical protein
MGLTFLISPKEACLCGILLTLPSLQLAPQRGRAEAEGPRRLLAVPLAAIQHGLDVVPLDFLQMETV